MARARNIKPAFFHNDLLGELEPIERLAFIGMWTIADYKGCIEYRPKRLKAQLLPYDNCDIQKIVINLEQSRFVTTYSVLGQMYLKIVNFEKHQNPHPNEKKAGSNIPDVTENDNSVNHLQNIVTNHEQFGTNPADSLLLIPDSPILIPEPLNLNPSGTAAKKSAAPKKKVEGTGETWSSYSNAYFDRYGVPPVRNVKTNSLVCQFVERIGKDEAPHVAAFFVSHNNAYYVKQMHSLGPMIQDSEKLRTEWATRSQMTHTKAMQTDKTQTNQDAFAPLLAEARLREANDGIQ